MRYFKWLAYASNKGIWVTESPWSIGHKDTYGSRYTLGFKVPMGSKCKCTSRTYLVLKSTANIVPKVVSQEWFCSQLLTWDGSALSVIFSLSHMAFHEQKT